jgi:hypothetical protein
MVVVKLLATTIVGWQAVGAGSTVSLDKETAKGLEERGLAEILVDKTPEEGAEAKTVLTPAELKELKGASVTINDNRVAEAKAKEAEAKEAEEKVVETAGEESETPESVYAEYMEMTLEQLKAASEDLDTKGFTEKADYAKLLTDLEFSDKK